MASSMLNPVTPSPTVLPSSTSVHHPSSDPSPRNLPHPPPPSINPPTLGVSASKINKRKSRGISKPPIKFFSANVENFMDMVQTLTGIPSNLHLPLAPSQEIVFASHTSVAFDPYTGFHHTASLNKESKSSSKAPRFSRFSHQRQRAVATNESSIVEGGSKTSTVHSRSLSKRSISQATTGHLPYTWDGSEPMSIKQELQYPWDVLQPKQEYELDGRCQRNGKMSHGLLEGMKKQGEISEDEGLFGDSAWPLMQRNC